MTTEIITDNRGTIYYFKGDKIHREDGPAVIFPNGEPCWYKHGQLHREDGPAVLCADGTQKWYLNGTEYSFDEWCKKANITDKQRTLLMLKYNPRDY